MRKGHGRQEPVEARSPGSTERGIVDLRGVDSCSQDAPAARDDKQLQAPRTSRACRRNAAGPKPIGIGNIRGHSGPWRAVCGLASVCWCVCVGARSDGRVHSEVVQAAACMIARRGTTYVVEDSSTTCDECAPRRHDRPGGPLPMGCSAPLGHCGGCTANVPCEFASGKTVLGAKGREPGAGMDAAKWEGVAAGRSQWLKQGRDS